ncbi:MAG: hypothetical protein ACLP1D_21810 [Xanthobacteraceae bacterium]
MRRLLRPLWFLLAVLFLVEEWLWDHLVPAIRLIVDAIPWRAFKTWLAGRIERLSPQATLVVFLIPAAIYFGLELLALWPMAYGRWLLALIVLGVAKVLGAAITAFAFDVTRDKLLQMDWFRRGYGIVIGWRDAAHRLADPYLTFIRRWLKSSRARSARLWQRLRSRAQPAAKR